MGFSGSSPVVGCGDVSLSAWAATQGPLRKDKGHWIVDVCLGLQPHTFMLGQKCKVLYVEEPDSRAQKKFSLALAPTTPRPKALTATRRLDENQPLATSRKSFRKKGVSTRPLGVIHDHAGRR